ncbi:MAG: zinc-binding dehydrogenase [Sediminimonas qiaohouensis]|uniref:Zinc-binding dehydrogenase n=1 Tax=Sediminimonas qiaohouensis TaxID=552061 RepID=A0A7C9LQE7_9RHOB|nr:alcohol dehydrogenase catalytic domain-containing protein [Sediminimonas qiaohouensis]MTJ05640.1 zinc-binding dehydrogenase [Sediminimonas qiaohouensis]
MRAARLSGWRQPLDLVDLPDPEPPEGGVVLKVLACGICRSDWHVWTGSDPDVSLPHVPGHEYCGEVVATGPGVRRWRVGDRVIAPFILACGACPACAAGEQTTCANQVLPDFTAQGAFAEHVAVAHADANLTTLPDAIAPELAAALGCRVTTAWHALTGRAALRPGEWLAVFGGGGVGISALLLARGLGARVVVVDVVQEKLEYARSLGADAVVDARAGDVAAAIREITQGGAHVALEALGVTETACGALNSLRKLGRMVQVGMPAGPHTEMTLPMDVVYSGQLAIYGTRGMPAWRYPDLLSFINAGQVDLSPLVTRRVALSGAADELALFDGPAPPGVAVITDFAN